MKISIILLALLSVVLGNWRAALANNSNLIGDRSKEAVNSSTVFLVALDCKEYKKRNGDKGKDAATDAPSWVKNEGHKPCKNPNEDGKAFAKRLLDAKYGTGNWDTGAATEHNKIQKYGDRAFE